MLLHGHRRILPFALALTLAACGSGDAQADTSGDPSTAEAGGALPAGRAAAAPASTAGDRFEATVGSAPFAGTHALTGAMTCMMFNGTWQAVHESDRSDGLSGMLLQVKEVPAAGGSSNRLTLNLIFGQMDDMSGRGGLLDVHGAEFGGDARATITREGAGAVIRVEGTAQSRAAVAAELRCASVDFMR